MKKILALLVGLMLFMPMVLAGGPTPKPFVVYINFDGAPVEGLNVDFNCDGISTTKVTNNLGGVLVNIGGYGDFNNECSILKVDCGYDSCRETFNTGSIDCPICEYTYELSEAPPEPEPECIVDSDCSTGYECVNENCVYIEPEPEPIVEDKVTSNVDNTIASVESNFGECIDVVITDTKLDKLFDGIIDFNTEDYDVHEELRVKTCSETSIDDVDYGLEPYVLVEEGAIEYCYVFDDVLPLSEIEADEELEIKFLNDTIEIISLSSSKMTIRHGDVFDYLENCVEGESIDFDGLPITIGTIGDDFVYVTYNGDSEQIYREDTGTVGGIQIYVDEAIPRDDKLNICKIRVAIDIEEVIEDGDEYNTAWDYSITEGNICIVNSEEFKYLDEETKPLTLGDKIVLPNDFAVIKFNEITTSETTDIRIKLRDGLFNILGDREDGRDDSFTYDNQDYDELYVGAEGILDRDKIFISNKVRIGESEVYLEQGSIIIGDLVIESDFLDILYKGISYALDDDSLLTHEGIIFKNPENSVKDKSTFDLIVPDEVPEIVITIGAESETIGVEPEPIVCTPEDCAEVTYDSPTCQSCPPVPEPCEECQEDCPIIPEGLTGGQILIYIISLLGVGGIGAFAGTKLTGDRISRIKGVTYRVVVERDGDVREEHRHAGIRSYHSINTSHRVTHEKHPRGERYPLYEKDETGVYRYIG